MSSGRPTQQGPRISALLVAAVLLAIAVGVAWYCRKTQDPLSGKTPDIVEELTRVKTRAENGAQLLKASRIDGRRKYEDVQVEANGCIGYLHGVLDDGRGDEQKVRDHLNRLAQKCDSFREWADEQLQARGGKGSVGAVEIDWGKLAVEIMKLLDKQEADRRKRVKDTLNGCKLRSWNDLPAGQGSLGDQ